MKKCKLKDHKPNQIGPDRGFAGSVSLYDQNPAAHGNICVTEECTVCGAQREVNINGMHDETGEWGPTSAQRLAMERRAAHEMEVMQRAKDLRAAREAGVKVLSADRQDGLVQVQIRDEPVREVSIVEIAEAAAQEDNGDGLVPIYSGMLLMAREAMKKDMSRPFSIPYGY